MQTNRTSPAVQTVPTASDPVMIRCLTYWRRLQDVDCVNVCFGVCHPKLQDSPRFWRGVCNGAWLFPVWVTCLSLHLLESPPPSTHPSPSPPISAFHRKRNKGLLMNKHLWKFNLTLMLRNFKKPVDIVKNEKQMFTVSHMLMQAKKNAPLDYRK